MSNHYTTGEFTLYDGDLRYSVTAAYEVTPDGVQPLDLTLLRVAHSAYELPADEGYDPEPVVFDVRHTYQQIEFEKRLMADFEPDIIEACCEHASANAGVYP